MASSQPLNTHPSLKSLAADEVEIVVNWIQDLAKASLEPDAQVLLQNLDSLIFGNSTSAKSIPERLLNEIKDWLDEDANEAGILNLLQHALERAGKTRSIPRATPEQINIILESQEEVGVFWTVVQLEDLTRWQADTIIKGLIVRSEVRRATDYYDYPIRRLRRAVREELNLAKGEAASVPIRRPVRPHLATNS
jgi:hypothetical protein